MTIDTIQIMLNSLATALETVRSELANGAENDALLRQNEITIECLLKDWEKRRQNYIELQTRNAA